MPGRDFVADDMANRCIAFITSGLVYSAAALGQTAATWVRLGPPTAFAAGVWDSARERIVLTGGSSEMVGTTSVETWEWNGSQLLQQPASGPTRRKEHAMAYDELRRRVVLFGGMGVTTGTFLGDTWEFDGVSWSMASSSGPPGRMKLAMAFDGNRNRVVMTGGVAVLQDFPDCWEWDGANWNALPGIGGRRANHGMVYDPLRRRMVLHSGDRLIAPFFFSSAPVPETLEFDGLAWQAVGNGPLRIGPGTTFDAQRGKVLLYAGMGSPTGSDLWEWDGANWSAITTGNAPPALARATLVFDPVRNRTLLATHDLPVHRSKLWSLGGNQWRPEAERPGSDLYPAVGVHEGSGTVVMFGGRSLSGFPPFPTDTWTFDGSRWTGAVLSPSPPAQASVSLVYDRVRSRLVLFGGLQPNTLWGFDGIGWSVQQTATAPPARHGYLIAYDAHRDRIVVVGGVGPGNVPLSDTWEFDGTTWTQVVSAVVPPLGYYMLYDDARRAVLMFFQRWVSFPLTSAPEAWRLDGNGWSLAVPLNPAMATAGRYAFGYDRSQGVIAAILRGTSRWNLGGTQWVPAAMPPLPDATNGVLLFDPIRGYLLQVGDLPVALTTRPGNSTALSTGCAAAAATLQSQRGRSGDPIWLDVVNAPSMQPGLMLLSTTTSSTALVAGCPFILGPIGASVLFVTNAAGFATVAADVPGALALRGSSLFLQAVVLAPTSAVGFTLTTGVRITLGD